MDRSLHELVRVDNAIKQTGRTNFINCKEVENHEQRMQIQLRKRQVIEMHKNTKLEIDTKLEKELHKKGCQKSHT